MSANKKIITLAVSAVAIGVMSTTVNAENLIKSVEAYINPSIKTVHEGKPIVFKDENGQEQPVIIYNGRTYLPLRSVAGIAGMDIKWDEANKTVIINDKSSTSSDSSALATDALNATYVLGKGAYTLTDGKFQKEAAPGSASKIEVAVWGPSVKGDLNGDGKEDEAVILSYNGGGSGTFYYVAAVLNNTDGQKVEASNAILLGDRLGLQNISVNNRIILVNYADRKPDEPMSAKPSVGVSKYFKIEDGILKEASENN